MPGRLPRELTLSPKLILLLDEASRAVSMLAGVGETVPNLHLLIRPLLRREAVLSSKIEGINASLTDVFEFETSSRNRPRGDVEEVWNYVNAVEYGIERLGSLPI